MRADNMEKENKSDKKQLRCPFCDEEIAELQYPFCEACKVEVKRCPECGKVVSQESETCPECGTKINACS
jgi:endogenous inhibitor of DNA gyrase (YacG/DUF329 family)